MNICFITTTVHIDLDLKESIGSTTHTFSLAKEFLKLGHSIVIFSEKHPGDKEYQKIQGIHVFRLKRGIIATAKSIKKSKFKAFLKYFRFIPNLLLSIKIAKICANKRIDLVLERSHSRGVGAFVSYLLRKPLITQAHDYIFSPLSIRRAKYIFVHSRVFFKKKIQEKIVPVTCGIDPKVFFEVKKEKKFDLCYLGGFKEWDGLETLVEAISLLTKKTNRISVLMVGDGKVQEEIKSKIKKMGLSSNFTFTGKVPLCEVRNHLSECKIGIAPFNTKKSVSGKFSRFGFYYSPLKIFEYAACGLPIITTGFKQIRAIIEKEGAVFSKENNSKELASDIERLLQDKNKRHQMAKYNNKLVNHKYTWQQIVKEMNKYLKKATKE